MLKVESFFVACLISGYLLGSAVKADTDYTCVDSCIATGRSFQFCHDRICSYTNSREVKDEEDVHMKWNRVDQLIDRGLTPEEANREVDNAN